MHDVPLEANVLILLCDGNTEAELARVSNTWREQLEFYDQCGDIEREGEMVRFTDEARMKKRTLTIGEMIERARDGNKR